MKTLNFVNPITCANSHFSPSIFLLHFTSFSRVNQKFILTFPTKSLCVLKPIRFSLIRAPSSCDSVNYGGWDDVQLGGDLVSSGESTQFRDFLVSRGIDDKKHVFMFLLGIFSAFAISRVRVSTIIVFPASVLIFALGFSLGFFRGGSFSELSVNASKKRAMEEIFKVYSERLRILVGSFDRLDVKVNDLKNAIQRAIDTKEIELGDLEDYVSVIESIQSSALNCRNAVVTTVDSVGNSSNVVSENQKSSGRKKKEIREVGFGLLQFLGGLFGEKLVDSKPNKVKDKDNVKHGLANNNIQGNGKDFADDQTQENSSTWAMEEGSLNAVDNDKKDRPSMFSQGLRNKSALNWDNERRNKIISEDAKLNSGEIGGNGKRFVDGGEYSYQSNRLHLADNHHISWKMNQNNETDMWKSHENMHDCVDFNIHFKHTETEASFVREQFLKQSSETYRSSYSRKINEDETYRSQFGAEGQYDDSCLTDHQPVLDSDVGSTSSMVSDDVVFDRYLTESNNLLKQAKECIRGKNDEEHAEIILYKAAKLLSKAIVMKPMSLLAVGLLGNTYLLHGELKLKISRELRTLLSRRDHLSVENQDRIFKRLDEQVTNREKLASSLVNVCEECEELLVEAGRKYRLALSIDGNDVRALYNWGLALSFRAQLIADIGPEAAFDADKVFLAAINKFDAMMSKGNEYAPDALFRWGMVLQQRSRLRPRNSKEKVKLLMQAKRLYEDALDMDSGNLQVREALSSCVAEINHRLL